MAGMLALSALGTAIGISAGLGQMAFAARLLAATRSLSRLTGSAPIPLAEAIIREVDEQIVASLDQDEYQRSCTEGQSMTLPDAIAQTLSFETVSEPVEASIADSRRPRPEVLTAREREILQLVAQGQTSREIAESLVVSLATVERHLTHIYGKLGVRGRADAVVWAIRSGIAE